MASCDAAYFSIGCAYYSGLGVERDKKKAMYYTELAAMKGDSRARQSLGVHEYLEGNMERAIKHYTISLGDGFDRSLKAIRGLYSKGYVTKDDYAKALRAYQEYLDDIRSPQRDEAAAQCGLQIYLIMIGR